MVFFIVCIIFGVNVFVVCLREMIWIFVFNVGRKWMMRKGFYFVGGVIKFGIVLRYVNKLFGRKDIKRYVYIDS